MFAILIILGLVAFLYGMFTMCHNLKELTTIKPIKPTYQSAASSLKGLAVGFGFTSIIQSSSAVAVLVIGLTDNRLIPLNYAICLIMGAETGTATTSWLTALPLLPGINSSQHSQIAGMPHDLFLPILILIISLIVLLLQTIYHTPILGILAGAAMLLCSMKIMSIGASSSSCSNIVSNCISTATNPVICLGAGFVFTAFIQSSSAAIGILQALSLSGAITYNAAIPFILGINTGTCITALLTIPATTITGRSAAIFHLYCSAIGSILLLCIFELIHLHSFNSLICDVTPLSIAVIHCICKVTSLALLFPVRNIICYMASGTAMKISGFKTHRY